MIQDLDATLKELLQTDHPDALAPAQLRAAEVSFVTPDRNYAPDKATVNLFLYEVKENRELRDRVPIHETVDNVVVRRMPPLRMDCCYIVTAWSAELHEDKIVEEHRLLSQALIQLTRFPAIKADFFKGSLIGQPVPPPISIAQVDAGKEMRDFWTALGTSPRPLFHLVVTLAMAPEEMPVSEGPPVVAKQVRIKEKMPNGIPEPVLAEFFEIAGAVTNRQTSTSITGAQVRLVELGRQTTSDGEGHYRFAGLEAGGYTLRAEATGFLSEPDKVIVVPLPQGETYDITLTPSP